MKSGEIMGTVSDENLVLSGNSLPVNNQEEIEIKEHHLEMELSEFVQLPKTEYSIKDEPNYKPKRKVKKKLEIIKSEKTKTTISMKRIKKRSSPSKGATKKVRKWKTKIENIKGKRKNIIMEIKSKKKVSERLSNESTNRRRSQRLLGLQAADCN